MKLLLQYLLLCGKSNTRNLGTKKPPHRRAQLHEIIHSITQGDFSTSASQPLDPRILNHLPQSGIIASVAYRDQEGCGMFLW